MVAEDKEGEVGVAGIPGRVMSGLGTTEDISPIQVGVEDEMEIVRSNIPPSPLIFLGKYCQNFGKDGNAHLVNGLNGRNGEGRFDISFGANVVSYQTCFDLQVGGKGEIIGYATQTLVL